MPAGQPRGPGGGVVPFAGIVDRARPASSVGRQARYVGLSADGTAMVLRVESCGEAVLPLDEEVLEVLGPLVLHRCPPVPVDDPPARRDPPVPPAGAGRQLTGSTPVPDTGAATGPVPSGDGRSRPRLAIREIQAMLRAGRPLEEVAVLAGVEPANLERWAVPVWAELAAVIDRARALRLERARRGPSALPLGVAVASQARRRWGPAAGEDGWGAGRIDDDRWLISYTHRVGRREHRAEWELETTSGRLRALNRLGTELGWVDPEQSRPRVDARPRRARAAPVDPVAAPRTHRSPTRTVPTVRRRPAGDAAARGPARDPGGRRAPEGAPDGSRSGARRIRLRARRLPPRSASR